MTQSTKTDNIDYLLIGHLTADLQADQSVSLGGTACFSGLTAARLGHKVAIVTSCAKDLDLEPLRGIQTHVILQKAPPPSVMKVWEVPASNTSTLRQLAFSPNIFPLPGGLASWCISVLWQRKLTLRSCAFSRTRLSA